MRKPQIPPIVTILLIAVGVIGLGFFLYRTTNPQAPTGNFTPGVPPWLDPKLKGTAQAGQATNNWHPSAQTTPTQ